MRARACCCFCFVCFAWGPACCFGQLFVDANQNNKRDPGEVGAAGARLVLTDKDGAPIIGSNGLPLVAFTNFDGNYSITLYEEYGAAVRLQLEGTADIAGVDETALHASSIDSTTTVWPRIPRTAPRSCSSD